MSNEIDLRLSRDEALVLFEFLSRFSDEKKLVIEDQAEARVLWDILSDLESSLPEPLKENYKKLLTRARNHVREHKEDPAAPIRVKDATPCAGLVRKRLYEVVFVLDYVQLRFDGDEKFITISAYAPVRVVKAEKEYRLGDDGHKDALCSLIEKNVQSVDFDEEKGLEFQLETSETVKILAADRLKDSPEWINYIDDKDHRNDLYY